MAPEPPPRVATLADFAVERGIGIGGFGRVSGGGGLRPAATHPPRVCPPLR